MQVRAALLMTTENRYTMLYIYYECAATKMDQQHAESWLTEIEWIVETASWFIVGVSNPAPREQPSYGFQLQSKSNTPEPANQRSSRLVHVTQVCWEQGRNWNLQDGSSPGAGLEILIYWLLVPSTGQRLAWHIFTFHSRALDPIIAKCHFNLAFSKC